MIEERALAALLNFGCVTEMKVLEFLPTYINAHKMKKE